MNFACDLGKCFEQDGSFSVLKKILLFVSNLGIFSVSVFILLGIIYR